jgi:hypothetical protein
MLHFICHGDYSKERFISYIFKITILFGFRGF